MRGILIITGILVGLSSMAGPLLACGDKLFMVGVGGRFSDAYAAIRPGNVVIYTQGTLPKGKDHLTDPGLHKGLKRAGHKLTIAANPAELAKALQTGAVDVVLVPDSQTEAIRSEVRSARSNPALISVGIAGGGKTPPAGPAEKKAEKRPKKDKGLHLYVVIEDAMKERAAAGLWQSGR